jgi:outer membrane murein-binding lipoprotein Lpp
VSEESTRETSDARTFEERVFARFDALDAGMKALDSRMSRLEERVDQLEEKVDRRLQETRPIWEAVQEQLRRLNSKVDILISDLYEMRANVASHEKRLTSLEEQRAQ